MESVSTANQNGKLIEKLDVNIFALDCVVVEVVVSVLNDVRTFRYVMLRLRGWYCGSAVAI